MLLEILLYLWETHVYIGKLEIELLVDVRCDEFICFEDLLDVYVDKMVERVDVLLHQSSKS